MKNKVFSFLMIFALVLTAGFIGMGKVDAFSITYKNHWYDKASGVGMHTITYNGKDYVGYCLEKPQKPPKEGTKMTCDNPITTGKYLWIFEQSGYSRVDKQVAIWYLQGKLTTTEKNKWSKGVALGKKAANMTSYNPKPSIALGDIGALANDGTYWYKQVPVTLVNASSYTVTSSFPGTEIAAQTNTGFWIRIPVSKVTQSVPSFTVTVSATASHYVRVRCTQPQSTQDITFRYPQTTTVSASKTGYITTPKCAKVGSVYYGISGTIVSEAQWNLECNPKCEIRDGKYYNDKGQVVSEEEYNRDCNPKCEIKNGKYYNGKGKEVTEEEYNEECNPKCEKKDGKYYNKAGKQVTLEEYYEDCFPPTPPPTPVKSVDTEFIRYEQDYHYTIKHEVPHRTSNNFFKSYVFTDVLEDPLQVKSEDDVKIMQVDKATGKETNWTNKFVIKIDGQKVTATLKDANDKDFYGTRDANDREYAKEYSFILTASLKENAEKKYDMSKYKKGDVYEIPDVANISFVNKNSTTTSQDTNKVIVKYTIPAKPNKIVSGLDQTASYENGTKYQYTITYQVLDYKGNQKYKSFEFVDEFEDPIKIDSASDLVIKDENAQDVTSWFDVKVKGQKLTATLKDEHNNDNFYGHTYSFIVSVSLKQGYNIKKYLKGNQYVIPNYADIIIDNKQKLRTNIVNVTVALKSVPKIMIPNTGSPLQVAAVAAGIAIIISGVVAILQKYKLLPIKK